MKLIASKKIKIFPIKQSYNHTYVVLFVYKFVSKFIIKLSLISSYIDKKDVFVTHKYKILISWIHLAILKVQKNSTRQILKSFKIGNILRKFK